MLLEGRPRGEITIRHRLSPPQNVGVSDVIGGHGHRVIGVGPGKIRRVREIGAGRIQFRNEHVLTRSLRRRLVRDDRGGKVRGVGCSRDVSIAGIVHGEAGGGVRARRQGRAINESRVNHRRSERIQFADKDVRSAGQNRAGRRSAGRPGKGCCRCCGSRQINTGVGIHGHTRIDFIASAAKIGGIGKDGIDDEIAAAVILAERETDPILAQHLEASADGLTLAIHVLVNRGLVPAHFAHRSLQAQAAVSSHGNAIDATNLETNLSGIGPGANRKVIFKLALLAVIDQVDSRVDGTILHVRECRHVAHPAAGIVAAEVVALAGQRLAGRDAGARGSPFELHMDRRTGSGIPSSTQSENRFVRSQKEAVTRSMSDVGSSGIRLPPVGLKSDGQFGGDRRGDQRLGLDDGGGRIRNSRLHFRGSRGGVGGSLNGFSRSRPEDSCSQESKKSYSQ